MAMSKTRKIVSALLVTWVLGGCNAHQSEDAAREEVKAQDELSKSQAAIEAAENAELRKSELK
jgi:hypothetical protein